MLNRERTVSAKDIEYIEGAPAPKNKEELYFLLEESMQDIKAGRSYPADEVFADIRKTIDKIRKDQECIKL